MLNRNGNRGFLDSVMEEIILYLTNKYDIKLLIEAFLKLKEFLLW